VPKNKLMGLLWQSGWTSCHQTNNIKALKNRMKLVGLRLEISVECCKTSQCYRVCL